MPIALALFVAIQLREWPYINCRTRGAYSAFFIRSLNHVLGLAYSDASLQSSSLSLPLRNCTAIILDIP